MRALYFREEEDLEDISLLQTRDAQQWTAWRGEGRQEREQRDLTSSFQEAGGRNQEQGLADLSVSFQEGLGAVKEKFDDLSSSRIEDLSATELGELISSLEKVEEEGVWSVRQELHSRSVRRSLEDDGLYNLVADLEKSNVEAKIEVDELVEKQEELVEEQKQQEYLDQQSRLEELDKYEEGLIILKARFEPWSSSRLNNVLPEVLNDLVVSVGRLEQDSINELEEQLNKKRKAPMVQEEHSAEEEHLKQGEQEERKQEGQAVSGIKKEIKEEIIYVEDDVMEDKPQVLECSAVNSTLAPLLPPPPPAPALSPISKVLPRTLHFKEEVEVGSIFFLLHLSPCPSSRFFATLASICPLVLFHTIARSYVPCSCVNIRLVSCFCLLILSPDCALSSYTPP